MQALYFDIMARDLTPSAFKSVEKSALALSRSMREVGQTLSLAVTAPMVALGASVLTTAGNFEEAMAHVDMAAGGLDGAAFDALSEKALQLGEQTAFSAIEGANAIEMLIRNGLVAEQVLGGAADAAVSLAAATKGALAPAADVITDVMAQFDRDASALGDVASQVSGVLVNSKFGFNDYALALGQAGGVAGAVGVEFEDFNAVIAGTSSSFDSGSDAGTSFKVFLQRLVPQTEGAATAMSELGLSFFDASGDMKNMADIAESLKNGFSGLSDEQKILAGAQIFGQDAMRTAFALADQGADGINRLREAIGSVDAAAQSARGMDTYNAALREFGGALETLSVRIGQSGLLSWAESMVRGVTEVARSMSGADPAVMRWGTIVAGAAAAVGPLLIGLGMIAPAVASGMAVLSGVGAAIAGALTWPVIAAGAAVAGAAMAFDIGFSDIAAAIGSLASAAGPMLADLSGTVNSVLGALGEAVGPALDGMAKGLSTVFADVAASAGPALGALGDSVASVVANIGAAIGPGADHLVASVSVFGERLGAAFEGLGAVVGPAAAGAASALAGVVTQLVDTVGPGLASAAGVIADALGGFASGFASSFDIGPALATIAPALDAIAPAMAAAGRMVDALAGAFGALRRAVDAAFSSMTGQTLSAWLGETGAGFETFGSAVGTVVSTLLTLPFEAIRAGFGVLGAAFDLVAAGARGAEAAFNALADGTAVAKLQALGGEVSASLAGVWDNVVAAVDAGVERVVSAFDALASRALESVQRLVDGVTDWMTNKLGAVWDTVAGKLQWIGDQFYQLYDAVVGHSYVPDMVTGIEREMVGRLGAILDTSAAGLKTTAAAFAGFGQDVVGSFKGMVRDGVLSMEELGAVGPRILAEMRDRIVDSAFAPIAAQLDAAVKSALGAGNPLQIADLIDVTGIELKMARVAEVVGALNAQIADSARSAGLSLEQTASKTKGVFEGIGSSIVGGLKSILADGKITAEEFRDFVGGIFEDLWKRVLDKALNPLEKALDNLFSGEGGGPLGGMDKMFDGLFDGIAGALDGLISGLSDALGGIFKGLGGFLSKIFGGLFGGWFADGGTLAAGKWGIVGEEGPELIGPGRSARTIVPMRPVTMDPAAAAGGGGTMRVVANVRMQFDGYMSRDDVKMVAEAAAREGVGQAVQIAAKQVVPILAMHQRDRGA